MKLESELNNNTDKTCTLDEEKESSIGKEPKNINQTEFQVNMQYHHEVSKSLNQYLKNRVVRFKFCNYKLYTSLCSFGVTSNLAAFLQT